MRGKLAAVALAMGLVGALGPWQAAPSTMPTVNSPTVTTAEATALAAKSKVKAFKNCTALNKVYRHGVGKTNAKDKTSGRSKPVRNFTKNNALYNANKKMDRDKDGIACEKR